VDVLTCQGEDCQKCVILILKETIVNNNGFVHQERVNELLAMQAASTANMVKKSFDELRQEIRDLKDLVTAIVMANNGELHICERDLYMARKTDLESYQDKANRRWVLRCKQHEVNTNRSQTESTELAYVDDMSSVPMTEEQEKRIAEIVSRSNPTFLGDDSSR